MKVQRSVSSHGTLTMLSCHTVCTIGYQPQNMLRTDTWSRFPACKPPNNLQQSAPIPPLWVYGHPDNSQCGPSNCLMHLQYAQVWQHFFEIFHLLVAFSFSPYHSGQYDCMMTSSNGNIFRVTGHLCGEFTGPRWIPHTKASDAELWCFLWSAFE